MKSKLHTLFLAALCGFSPITPAVSAARPAPALVTPLNDKAQAQQNLNRAMSILDNALEHYFVGEGMAMGRFYNPFTGKLSKETGSVWMYTSAIEAVNAVLHALQQDAKNGDSQLHDRHFSRYADLLSRLYRNADYYLGSFELTSYTQTKVWSVYAVDRAKEKGEADVSGILNVYDDQMWLIRELLESYRITGKHDYLTKAEYLTEYVLDGWDTTLDEKGKENGGIPWGPGYVTKHACSNGPLVSPLVWLHEIYADKDETVEYRHIAPSGERKADQVQKKEYYLNYAKKVYQWQKDYLLNSRGVYTDMMGGCVPDCKVAYQEVQGVRYRKNTPLTEAVGQDYTYNSGTMLSGAADLFRATGQQHYAQDAQALASNSFKAFAAAEREVPGHYSYQVSGFRNWFNGVLLRGYADLYPALPQVKQYTNTFQQNLDYAYQRFNQQGFLPTNLLKGWDEEKTGEGVEGMFQFTFAANYAVLSAMENK